VESLRWILLAAGIIFVLIIYFIGRNRRRQNDSYTPDLDEELPEFSARSLDDLDEGVGEVRVVTSAERDDMDPYSSASVEATETSATDTDVADTDGFEDVSDIDRSDDEPTTEAASAEAVSPSDIIVLYILPKADNVLVGSQINSSAQAMGLSFGDMNIFHYRPGHRNIFSLANMVEPGSFDADTIHDLKTSGLTVFMQLSGNDPMDDLTEMLQRSYQLAGLLDARLCNSRRQAMTEQDAENYREQVRAFIARQS
jgi:cell division protein ZipA